MNKFMNAFAVDAEMCARQEVSRANGIVIKAEYLSLISAAPESGPGLAVIDFM